MGILEAENMTSVKASDASVDEEMAAFMNEDDSEFLSLLEGLNSWESSLFLAVLRIRIRIHLIHMFLGLPDPDPLVRGLDPDPSIKKQE